MHRGEGTEDAAALAGVQDARPPRDRVAQVTHHRHCGGAVLVDVEDRMPDTRRQPGQRSAGPEEFLPLDAAGQPDGQVGAGFGGLHDERLSVVEPDTFQPGAGTAVVTVEQPPLDHVVTQDLHR